METRLMTIAVFFSIVVFAVSCGIIIKKEESSNSNIDKDKNETFLDTK